MSLTRDEAVTEVRDLVNEASASFWTDAEIIRHLNRGAMQVVNLVGDDALVRTQYQRTTTTTTSNEIPLPSDFLRAVEGGFEVGNDANTLRHATEVRPGEEASLGDAYREPSYENPYVAYYPGVIRFWQRPAGMLGSQQTYRLRYIGRFGTPTSGTADYGLEQPFERAIVHYAAGMCFQKKEADRRADYQMKQFSEILQGAGVSFDHRHKVSSRDPK